MLPVHTSSRNDHPENSLSQIWKTAVILRKHPKKTIAYAFHADMIKLTLMRHAKSDWSTAEPDINRPLNKRGERDALCMGRYLQQENLLPDRIIISPARRTRQTAELLLSGANAPGPRFIVDEALYLASPNTLINAIEQHATDGQHLLVLAHNPGMDDLVSYLASKPPALSDSGKLMPTCAAAHFQLQSTDRLKQAAAAELKYLIRVKEIDC